MTDVRQPVGEEPTGEEHAAQEHAAQEHAAEHAAKNGARPVAPERAREVARRVHGIQEPPPPPTHYIGLVTRVIAFVVDAAIINTVAAITAAAGALILSLFPISHDLRTVIVAIAGALFFVWVIAYFATFWATTGQTPGNRMLRIRVERTDGRRLRPRQALLRVIGLVLAALPLFAGYVPILFTDRRRGLADWLARTVVVSSDGDVPPLGS